MDSKDFRLLVALHDDARQSLQALARKVSLSAPAVRERLRRLADRRVLQGYWLSIDPSIFGRQDLLVFFGGDWSREDATRALLEPDVAWVAWKVDGGLTIQLWPYDAEAAVAALERLLRAPPAGRAIARAAQRGELSPIDWRLIDALIDDPRIPVRELSRVTHLSPKTIRKHLTALLRSEAISIVPRIASPADSGNLVYHLAVGGTASLVDLRRNLGDAVLIHETQEPPIKYLLCRAGSLGELTTKTHQAGKLAGVESLQLTLNREMLIGTHFVHLLSRARIDEWKKAGFRRSDKAGQKRSRDSHRP